MRTGSERREFYIENRRMTAAIRRLPAILFAHHAPEGIRTPDHQLRKLLLYPAELQVHKRIILYNVKPRIARGKVRNVRQDTRQDWARNPYDRKPGTMDPGRKYRTVRCLTPGLSFYTMGQEQVRLLLFGRRLREEMPRHARRGNGRNFGSEAFIE